MKASDVGEFALIKKLADIVSISSPELIVGIGDDASVWKWGNKIALATTDALVEGVHFRLEYTGWYDLGWKAIAVNLSDIAAMGGVAKYALVTIGLSPETSVDGVIEMYSGMADICRQFGLAITGGDTVSSPSGLVISVAVLGQARTQRGTPKLLLRSRAQPGDLIAVTGWLGSSAAGLETLIGHTRIEPDLATILHEAHLRPRPRLQEGQELAALGVQSGMDISDGLAGDLQKICERSGVAGRIRIDKLPVHPAVSRAFPSRCLEFALYGGEDYELLFCAPHERIARVIQTFRRKQLAPITVVGEITMGRAGEITLVWPDGKEGKPWKGGYDHFRKAVGE